MAQQIVYHLCLPTDHTGKDVTKSPISLLTTSLLSCLYINLAGKTSNNSKAVVYNSQW